MKNANIVLNKIYRLRSSVALVYHNGIMEFFKTNIRESIKLKTSNLINLLSSFDGNTPVYQIINSNQFDRNGIINLIEFLNDKFILIEEDIKYPKVLIKEKYRLINFLEDFCQKTSEVLNKITKLKEKTVLIVGLGGVGSFIVDLLARNGVCNFILIDDDTVDLHNLHRQNLYFQCDVGKLKIDCISNQLLLIDKNIKVTKIYQKINEDFFNNFSLKCDLMINCADYPNVDITTEIIGKYGMKHKIPHIIGGGYNLHLTLIGQTVVPYKSACHRCFQIELDKINKPYVANLKKLNRKDRKIGSFTPLCSLSASLASMDAFKILCGLEDFLTNVSNRIEFNLRDMDFSRIKIPKCIDCEVCGG